MLDLLQLRAFVRISDSGSISAAARELRLPKSSVSRLLVRLEGAVETPLIERSTRQLKLTDAGRLLRRHAVRILDDVGEAENALGGLIGKPRGTLRVSVGFTFAAGPLAPMLPKFMADYPEVRVVLTVDNRNVDLMREDIDVSVRIGPLRDSEMVARKLTTMSLWPCASPGYLRARGTPKTVDYLLSHTLIAHAESTGPWQIKTPIGDLRDVQTVPGMVIPEPAVVKTLLIAGAGIGWLPDFHAREGLADGSLVRVLTDHQFDTLEVHALYPSHRSLSAKVRVFVDALVVHLAPVPAQAEPAAPRASRHSA